MDFDEIWESLGDIQGKYADDPEAQRDYQRSMDFVDEKADMIRMLGGEADGA